MKPYVLVFSFVFVRREKPRQLQCPDRQNKQMETHLHFIVRTAQIIDGDVREVFTICIAIDSGCLSHMVRGVAHYEWVCLEVDSLESQQFLRLRYVEQTF